MQEFGGVLFQMHPHHSDRLGDTFHRYFQGTVLGQGQVKLGHLVALHQVRIGIIFAVELGVVRNTATQGQTGHDGIFHCLAVDDRQGAGQTQADRADSTVGRGVLVVRRAGAKHLAPGLQLNVNFQANNSFVLHTG